MENHIVPECFIDTMLIGLLLNVTRNKRLNHQHGCYNVARELKTGDLRDKFGVGIIDNDKRKVDYLEECVELARVDFEKKDKGVALILLKHKEKHHYFIKICPVIENWIMNICEESGLILSQFELPDRLEPLLKISKSQSSMFDIRFMKLFKAIKNSGNPVVQKLEAYLKILKEENYQVDIKELINA
jgi:hypothetical protein